MRLAVYSSVAGNALPNLIALQDEVLAALPTVLVCPLRAGMAVTALRVAVAWAGEALIACPELARPIRRTGLHRRGSLDEATSEEIMHRFHLLLAR
ncbi:hypothetical protein BH20VER2_BH20VER2_18980 [soil metagenome]